VLLRERGRGGEGRGWRREKVKRGEGREKKRRGSREPTAKGWGLTGEMR